MAVRGLGWCTALVLCRTPAQVRQVLAGVRHSTSADLCGGQSTHRGEDVVIREEPIATEGAHKLHDAAPARKKREFARNDKTNATVGLIFCICFQLP